MVERVIQASDCFNGYLKSVVIFSENASKFINNQLIINRKHTNHISDQPLSLCRVCAICDMYILFVPVEPIIGRICSSAYVNAYAYAERIYIYNIVKFIGLQNILELMQM